MDPLNRQEQMRQNAQWSPIHKSNLLWIQQHNVPQKRIQTLVDSFTAEGAQIQIMTPDLLSSQALEAADLVILDTLTQVEEVTETIVMRVRLESKVPLVLFTSGHSTDQLIKALKAGADAIWSFNAPTEVLLARCRALLRRVGMPSSSRQ